MEVEIPGADSQFRLLSCQCGGNVVVYQSTVTGGRKQYRVKCIACGQRTPLLPCKHDAQVDWNGRFGR